VEFEFLLNGVLQQISLEKKEGFYVFSDGEKTYKADIQQISSHQISVLIDNVSFRIYTAKDKESRYFLVDGQQFVVKEPTEPVFLGRRPAVRCQRADRAGGGIPQGGRKNLRGNAFSKGAHAG